MPLALLWNQDQGHRPRSNRCSAGRILIGPKGLPISLLFRSRTCCRSCYPTVPLSSCRKEPPNSSEQTLRESSVCVSMGSVCLRSVWRVSPCQNWGLLASDYGRESQGAYSFQVFLLSALLLGCGPLCVAFIFLPSECALPNSHTTL